MTMPFNDLREFIDAARALGQVKEIHGAHWNLEIGALTELFAFKEPSPLVLFDQIPDHNISFRVAANLINTPTRSGLTVGMPADAAPIELVARWKELLKEVRPIPPRVLSSGPWTRVSLSRGHVIVRGPARIGMTDVRSTGTSTP